MFYRSYIKGKTFIGQLFLKKAEALFLKPDAKADSLYLDANTGLFLQTSGHLFFLFQGREAGIYFDSLITKVLSFLLFTFFLVTHTNHVKGGRILLIIK